MRADVTPSGAQDEWAHTFVQSRFVGDLINRRKLYPADLRDVLSRTLFVRQVADVVVDRLLGLQIDEDVLVYVIPVRSIECVVAEFRARPRPRPAAKHGRLAAPGLPKAMS